MKALSIVLVLLAAATFVDMHALGGFLFEEPFTRGGDNTAIFTVRNPMRANIDNVNVKLYIYDLGIASSSLGADIQGKDHVVYRVNVPIPKTTAPGTYITRITVENDKFREVKHAYVTVV